MALPQRSPGGKSITLPAPATGSDVGDLAVDRCVVSVHGHASDFNPLLPQVELTANRPERDRSTVVWLYDEEAAKHRVLIRGGLSYFATNGQIVETASPLYRDHGAGLHGSGESRREKGVRTLCSAAEGSMMVLIGWCVPELTAKS
jgi:hypothetical protein